MPLAALAQVQLGNLENSTFNRSSNPKLGAVLNGRAYFFADDPDPDHRALWKTDGTFAGTTRVAPLPTGLEPRALVGGTTRLFFFTLEPITGGYTLWTSDGVAAVAPVAN